jgi:CRISPR type I-E-associated protein CasB/Cse2
MTEPAAAPERAEHANRARYVSFLLKLAKPTEPDGRARPGRDKDRGALAALRRSLQDPNGVAASACPYVVPFLPKEADPFVERMFFLIGALFALHSEHAEGVSLGHLFRHINNDTSEGRQGKDNPSVRARFVALLDAHAEDVDVHVRHAISLGRANSRPLDWNLLIRDLTSWRHPDRWVQRQLARDFWRPTPDAPPPSTNAETVHESEASR